MELATCPICGDCGEAILTTAEYRLDQCESCSLVYKAISAEVSHEAVNESIYTPQKIRERQWSHARLRAVASRRIQLLKTRFPDGKGNILEIGCGTGEFLLEAQRQDCQVEAVDLSESFARYVNDELGVPCFHGRVDQLPEDKKDYDAVVAYDVFEHLTDPLGFLAEMIRRVRPGGLFHLEMPNWDCQLRRLLGIRWNMLNIRDHFLFTTHQTWKKLAQRMNLECLSLDSHESYWECGYALLFAILNAHRITAGPCVIPTRAAISIPAELSSSREKTGRVRRLCAQEIPAALSWFASPLSLPFRSWLSHMGRGTQISVILRKPVE